MMVSNVVKWAILAVTLSMGFTLSAQAQADSAQGLPIEGTLDRIDLQQKQVVIADQVMQLSDVLVIDGDQRLADQALERLRTGEDVTVRVQNPEPGKPPVIVEISTDGQLSP